MFNQWGELCFLRMGGGVGIGLGLISMDRLQILTIVDVGFRIVMYVLEWLLVWYSVRSATIRGEDGIDRWDFVIPPCMFPMQGMHFDSRGSSSISCFSTGAIVWGIGFSDLCVSLRESLNWGSPFMHLYSTVGGCPKWSDKSRHLISGSLSMALQNRLGAM